MLPEKPASQETKGDILTYPLAHDGNTFRSEIHIPLFLRILMLPLIGASAGSFYLFLLTTRDVLSGAVTARESMPGQAFCLLVGLVLGLPGLIGLLCRSTLVFDKSSASLTKVQRIGPIALSKAIPFAAVRLVSLTAEEISETAALYSINLVGGRRSRAITAAVSRSPQEAETMAKDLAAFLKVPFGDYRDSEPQGD